MPQPPLERGNLPGGSVEHNGAPSSSSTLTRFADLAQRLLQVRPEELVEQESVWQQRRSGRFTGPVGE
jgi:hypothetical protein